ncbi:MAG: hypothetical protein WAU01_07170 [Saprospiraceae bacterium]
MMNQYLIFAFLVLGFVSCKNEHADQSVSDGIVLLEKEYAKTKTDSTFNKLIQAIGKAVVDSENAQQKEKLLNKAIQLCSSPEKQNLVPIFQTELLKVNPDSPTAKDILWQLATSVMDKGNKESASILYSGYKSRYPNDEHVSEAEKYIIPTQNKMDEYFKSAAQDIFESPGENGINEQSTSLYIDMCESYALAFPKDTQTPEYLFRAAEMARALRSYPKMMSLYDWIYSYFPKYEKAPLALFLKGFAMDSEFKRPAEAKLLYEKFLLNHPQDSLAKDVRFLLNNLGKSDEEILKEMQKNQK